MQRIQTCETSLRSKEKRDEMKRDDEDITTTNATSESEIEFDENMK